MSEKEQKLLEALNKIITELSQHKEAIHYGRMAGPVWYALDIARKAVKEAE